MANRNEVYKCNVCGNIVEVINASIGELTCCDQPMQLLEENSVDAAKEKHVPVVEQVEEGILVKVGSVAHPMEEKHYIQWIELVTDDASYVHFLKPGEKPETLFKVKDVSNFKVREYCNLHGLWRN